MLKNTYKKYHFSVPLAFLLIAGIFFAFWGCAEAKQPKFASTGKAFEVNIAASSDNETAFIAYEDKRNGLRARVRKLSGGKWQDLADNYSPNGLVSAREAANPVLETRDNEVYVAFSDKADWNRARIRRWDGNNWQDLADENYPEGKISTLEGKEPEIKFNRSKTILYAAFWDIASGTRIRVMRWDGNFWENCADQNHPSGLVSESTAVEVNIAASQIDDSMYIAYEDTSQNDRIRVKKWDGLNWSDLSDAGHPDGYLSTSAGFNPSIAVDLGDNLYVAYPSPREGYLHVARWNGSNWNVIEAPSTKKSAEASLITDSSDNLWMAFSEKYKKNRWRLRLKKLTNGMWISVPKNKESYTLAKGKNTLDPSLAASGENIFAAFTAPGKRKARVISYNAAAY